MGTSEELHNSQEFVKKANELLEKKFASQEGSLISGQDEVPGRKPINWELIAIERLQMLNQIRDEMQAWNEAYLKERERGDRLEHKLVMFFENYILGVDVGIKEAHSEQPQEIKHTVDPIGQIRRTRSDWPARKLTYENHCRAHDAGVIKEKEPENASKEQETV